MISFSEQLRIICLSALPFFPVGCTLSGSPEELPSRQWLAGDHHIHSRNSVGWDTEMFPPKPRLGNAIYPIPMNALMAKHFGLSWTVTTDHGGPNHSKLNLERTYPELILSRQLLPDLIQFFGMELNMPAADHGSIIIPIGPKEAEQLYALEHGFDKREKYPIDASRDTEEKTILALRSMASMSPAPLLIINHPSISAYSLGDYVVNSPEELRRWNDVAPQIAVGMAGAPGHQATTIGSDGNLRPEMSRSDYDRFPTMGGFDQMTAKLGGFWDSMLGEGRRWWITANSDSHIHYTDGGRDFWPGEYSKTYVFAENNQESIIDGIRKGRIFVSTGDLISELFVTVSDGIDDATIGEDLVITRGSGIEVTIKIRDPETNNAHGDNPRVRRIDLIVGNVTGRATNKSQDTNATTKVIKRFRESDWRRRGEYLSMDYAIPNISISQYFRIRGTNTEELEPERDPRGENPWNDLWFYSNPIFVVPGAN